MLLLPIINELKIATKDRGVVRFGDPGIMNYAQLDMILECERQLREYGRIRIIVLKARQIGISTVIEAILFVLALYNQRVNALIVSHEKDSATHLLNMTRTYWDTYVFADYFSEKYNGRTHLAWFETGSEIQVVTAKNKAGGRSRTIHLLHASEVAFWDDGATLMAGLNNTIPSAEGALSAVFLESTANGIGNFFHVTWLGAVQNLNEFTPKFYPWHKHPEYTISSLPSDARAKFSEMGVLDAEEKLLRAMGIDDGRLLWRRYAIVNKCQGDVNMFHQEYPTNPREAFLSTGTNVFKLEKLAEHYQAVLNERKGRLIQVNNKTKFVEQEDGELTVFRNPGRNQEYIIGADATWTTEGDYAVAQILNRRTLEQVAIYRKKLDAIAFGQDLYLLGLHYNNALVAPESTGPGYGTIGVLGALGYPNIYRGPKLDHTPGRLTGDQYGWGTNKQTKPLAISHVVNALSQQLQRLGTITYGLQLHDPVTFDEMQNYVSDGRGGFCNSDGSDHDDTVMALGIAVAVNAIMPPPFEDVNGGPQIPAAALPIKGIANIPSVAELVNAAAPNLGVHDRQLVNVSAAEAPRAWEDWDDQ